MYFSKNQLKTLARQNNVTLTRQGRVKTKRQLIDDLDDFVDFDNKKSALYELTKPLLKNKSGDMKLIKRGNKSNLVDRIINKDNQFEEQMENDYNEVVGTYGTISKIKKAFYFLLEWKDKGYFYDADLTFFERMKTLIIDSIEEYNNINRKIIISMELNNDPDEKNRKFMTGSRKSLNLLFNHIRSGIEETEEQLYFSDPIENFMLSNVTQIFVVSKSREGQYQDYMFVDGDGRFFGKLNTSPFDLKRYQIISDEKDVDMTKEHCLIYALKGLNIDKTSINRAKLHINNCHFKRTEFKKLSDSIKKTFHVHCFKCNNNKIHTYKYGNYTDIIELGLHNNHYFIYEKCNIQPYSAKNWKDIIKKTKKNIHKITRLKKKKYYERTNKKSKLSSLSLIKILEDTGAFIDSDIFKDNPQISKKYNPDNYNETLKQVDYKYHINKETKMKFKTIITTSQHGVEHTYTYTKYNPIINKDKKTLSIKNGRTGEIDEYSLNTIYYEKIPIKKKEVKEVIIYADTETFTERNKRKVNKLDRINNIYNKVDKDKSFNYHTCFMIGFMTQEDKKVGILTKIKETNEKELLTQFMNLLCDKYKAKQYKIFFHNLKYDFSFFNKYFYVKSKCQKGGQLYECKILYRKRLFIYRDSYKLIPHALSKFKKLFGLKIQKEIMPYQAYNSKTIYKKEINTKYALSFLKEDEHKDFIKTATKAKCYFGKKIKHMQYMRYYLRKDVELLKYGMNEFNKIIKKLTGLNTFNLMTISSTVFNYCMLCHVFDDIPKLGGEIRAFIQKSVKGGRCCTFHNKKKLIDDRFILDFDAVSLYPSAIKRICDELGGFPKGIPKILKANELNFDFLNSQDYYYVTIIINKVNKHLPIPFISEKLKNGTTNNTNNPSKIPMVVDKITLEDYIKFHKIEYTIVKGCYFNEGFNKKFGEVVEHLFKLRLKYKQEGNEPMQQIIKLMLNSMYGKTIMKSGKDEFENISNKNLNNYLLKNYNRIIGWQTYNKYTEVKLMKSFLDHYNYCQVGSIVLSMSKRIMNEVMATAFDNDIMIYYQDTDSMHLEQEDLKKLVKIYNKKYNRELIGKQLGQFHSDFELDGAVEEVVSTKCIILGKKVYLDCLQSKNNKGEIIKGYHIRMKGISKDAIDRTAKIHGGIEKLYMKLYNGEKIRFNLISKSKKDKPVFGYDEQGHVYTKTKFVRELQFKN